jgi:hypothetical protein
MRRISPPAVCAAPIRSRAALPPIVVSMSVNPSSSRTRNALTKPSLVSWIRLGVIWVVRICFVLPTVDS